MSRITLNFLMVHVPQEDSPEYMLDIEKELVVPMSINLTNCKNVEIRPTINEDGELNYNRTVFEYYYNYDRMSIILDMSFEDATELINIHGL